MRFWAWTCNDVFRFHWPGILGVCKEQCPQQKKMLINNPKAIFISTVIFLDSALLSSHHQCHHHVLWYYFHIDMTSQRDNSWLSTMASSDFEVKPRDFCWVRPPGGPSKFIAVSEEYHVEHLQAHLGQTPCCPRHQPSSDDAWGGQLPPHRSM